MIKNSIFIVAVLMIIHGSTYAQTSTSVADSINKNFSGLIKESNNFKQYKVISSRKIKTMRQTIYGQVTSLEKTMAKRDEKIADQQQKLKTYKKDLATSNADLEAAIADKDKLSLLGVKTNKSTYNTVVSIVILVLFFALLTFIYKYRKSNSVTTEAKHRLEDNEKEFDLYKKKALETQQRLGRQIIDERKKVGHQTSDV